MNHRRVRLAAVAALVAAALGMAHAAVSAYWALGGTALLDTIGGDIERWGRERGPGVVAALWAIAALKAVVALAAPVVTGRPRWLPRWTRGRIPRVLSWIAAVTLVAYGGSLTVAGLAVESGLVDAAPDADRRALAWHAYLWDPWFLLWGLAFIAALWLTRGPVEGSRPSRAQPQSSHATPAPRPHRRAW